MHGTEDTDLIKEGSQEQKTFMHIIIEAQLGERQAINLTSPSNTL